MPPFSLYALDIPNTKQAFSVELNGWPIDSSDGGPQGYFSSSMVGRYVADGRNTVTIHLTAPPYGRPPLDRFQVRIRATHGEVFYFGWEPDDPARPLPFATEGHFTAHLPHGPWVWQTAPKITLNSQTKEAINLHIKKMFYALDTKDIDAAVDLFGLAARQGYVARDLPPEEADVDGRADWVTTFAESNWHLKAVDYSRLHFALIGEGRIVHVTGAGNTYVLMDAAQDANGEHTAFDIYLCLVNGQWTQIR